MSQFDESMKECELDGVVYLSVSVRGGEERGAACWFMLDFHSV